jgi:cell division protease FtsH
MYGRDRVTTGAGSDLRKATEIARDMVIEQGMGDGLRDQVFHENNGGMVFDKITHERPYSDATAEKIDASVKALLEQASERARVVLEKNRDSLDAMAKALLEEETLEEKAVQELLKDARMPKEAALY